MTSLLIGFVGMVLVPALLLSIVIARVDKSKPDYDLNEDSLKFTISSDSKSRQRKSESTSVPSAYDGFDYTHERHHVDLSMDQ